MNDSSADSNDTHAENVTVLAVQQLENFYSCINCKKSMQPNVKANIGICDSCETVQKLLSPKLSAKLMIEYNNDIVTVKAYHDALLMIVNNEEISWETLLCAPAFDVVYNKFHVVTQVSRQ